MPRQSPLSPGPDYKLSSLFAEETAKPTQASLFHLVTLELPAPAQNFCIADSNYDVTFGGVTYHRFPVKWTPAEVNSDGSIAKSSIAIANVSREIMDYVELYKGLRTFRVLVKTVYANVLDDLYFPQDDGTVITQPNPKANSKAYIEDEFYIDNYSANEQTVNFQLEPIIDLEIRLPRRRYMQDSCYWTYRDPDTCRYTDPYMRYSITAAADSTSVRFRSLTLDHFYVPLNTLLSTINPTNPTSKLYFTVLSHNTMTDVYTIDKGLPYSVSDSPVFSAGFVSCNKSFADCKERNNVANYGGFPGISSLRRVYL